MAVGSTGQIISQTPQPTLFLHHRDETPGTKGAQCNGVLDRALGDAQIADLAFVGCSRTGIGFQRSTSM